MGRDGVSKVAFALPSALEVLEAIGEGVLLVDSQWRITYLNQNAVSALGDNRDLVGMNLWELFPQAHKTIAWMHIHEAVALRAPVEFEFFSLDSGTWMHMRAHPLQNGLQLFFRDIGEAKARDALLRQSEERMRLALEASGDGAWDFNIPLGEVTMSRRFLQRLGYRGDRLVGKADAFFNEMLHPDDRALVEKSLADHLEGRTETYVAEYRLKAKDGSWVWNLDRGRIVERDPVTRAPVRMVGTATDRSERRRAEAEAQANSELLALAQSGAGAGVWEFNLETRAMKLSPRSLELHGLPADGPTEMSYDAWEALLHPEDIKKTRAAVKKAIRSRGTYSAEFRVRRGDGDYNWILGLGRAAPGGPGDAPRYVGLNIDISEEKRAATEIRRMQAELIHLSRLSAMGAMASTLAHEINQPLTVITNYVRGIRNSIWRNAGRMDDDLAAALAGAEASAQRAGEIIKRLRDHVAKGEVERRPEKLGKLVQEGSALALIGTGHLGIDHSLELDDEEALVLADRVQIQQVLVNLVRNAVEALENVPAPRRLVISSRSPDPDTVEISVTDNGSGITEEVREQLFTPFVTTKEHGMGVGLSICRTIIEAHAGHIWAETTPDGGTAIRFTLEVA